MNEIVSIGKYLKCAVICCTKSMHVRIEHLQFQLMYERVDNYVESAVIENFRPATVILPMMVTKELKCKPTK